MSNASEDVTSNYHRNTASGTDKSYRSLRRLTSSNDDLNLEVISLGHSIIELEVATFDVVDIVSRQLLLPLLRPAAIILRGDSNASVIVVEIGDYVTPTFVVVDAQGDDEVLAGVGHETKRPARPAAGHGEHVRSVNQVPGSLPHYRLLDDVEEYGRVDLVDLRGYLVTRSRKNSETVDKKQCWQRVHGFCCKTPRGVT